MASGVACANPGGFRVNLPPLEDNSFPPGNLSAGSPLNHIRRRVATASRLALGVRETPLAVLPVGVAAHAALMAWDSPLQYGCPIVAMCGIAPCPMNRIPLFMPLLCRPPYRVIASRCSNPTQMASSHIFLAGNHYTYSRSFALPWLHFCLISRVGPECLLLVRPHSPISGSRRTSSQCRME